MNGPLSCLTPGCSGIRWRRGCCALCYGRHKTQVRRKKTTWAELEQAGKILPAKTNRQFSHFNLTSGPLTWEDSHG